MERIFPTMAQGNRRHNASSAGRNHVPEHVDYLIRGSPRYHFLNSFIREPLVASSDTCRGTSEHNHNSNRQLPKTNAFEEVGT